eukprot:UN07435
MLTVTGYDNYNHIALQHLDINDFESCEFSTKSRAETIGDMKNYWHVSDTKIIQTTQRSSHFAFTV